MKTDFSALIRKSMILILDRFELDRSGFGFIDTKFNIVTGKDFYGVERYFQPDFICGWIQGRALESLAKHHAYFAAAGGEEELCRRLENALRRLVVRLEVCSRESI